MNVRVLFCKAVPAALAAVLFACACSLFTVNYVLNKVSLQPFFDLQESANYTIFLVTFYVPFAISALALYGLLFTSGFYLRGLCIVAGFAGTVISGYVLDDTMTIKLCMYSAYVIVTSAAFNPPKNYYIAGFSLFFFILFLYHPPFLGPALGETIFPIPNTGLTASLSLYLAAMAVVIFSVRYLANRCLSSDATVSHLNFVGAKMLLFNHRLQEHAKNSGEEAIKKDRLRFTRDLHDSSGYVFTNIIAITDAALSFPEMEPIKIRESLQVIQNQAREGLKKTRETLYMIRELQEPISGSIDTIFKMKAIFEDVTGIKVDIESGNMKHDYGRTINKVLTTIVQEAFTNSIRHGQATKILIQFWEFPQSLSMTVSDNGIGARNIVKGIGLAGMEERVAAVGGTLEVSSPEDGGFRLRVNMPIIIQKADAL